MALTSIQKGNIIESQIANILMLVSDGDLTPSLPIVDDYGVDIVLGLKGSYNTLCIQVKSRFITNSRYKNRLDFQIQKSGFQANNKLFIVCVYFDQSTGTIDTMWLIPSLKIARDAVSTKNGYRVVASRTSNSNDKWSGYKVSAKELVEKMQDHLKGYSRGTR